MAVPVGAFDACPDIERTGQGMQNLVGIPVHQNSLHLLNIGPELQRLTLSQLLRRANWTWHGVKLGQPDWTFDSHSLALNVADESGNLLHVILNAYWEPLDFELPQANNGSPWRQWIDTSLDSPHDIIEWHSAPPVEAATYRAGPRSVVALCNVTARP